MKPLCLIIGMTLLVAGGAGCELPAQLVFSPDGTHAAWRVGDQAHLLDGDGKPLRPLGRSIGGFAWSADSQTLYFATATESAPPGHDVPAMSIERQWLDPVGPPASTQASTETTIVPAMPATATATTVATTAPATQAGGPDSAAIVQMLRGDTATPLFRLDWPVWHMALSPDGAWLALLSFNEETDRCNLHAFSLESRRLYILSESCGNAMCFTGPRRLAYVRPDCDNENFEHLTGKLVEVKLEDESLPELARTELLDVVPAHTPWMQALPEGDLLFTAFPRSFPASATIQPSEESAYKLFHFSRPNRGVTAIVEEAGRLFLPSPDGKRVLFEKITPATSAMPMKRELALMNANGSDVTVLRDLGQYTDLPMWPTWRGNDEIAFVPPSNPTTRPAAVDGDQRVHFDVVLYRLVNGATLDVEPARVLSTGWPDAMKPFMKLAAPEPTTKE